MDKNNTKQTTEAPKKTLKLNVKVLQKKTATNDVNCIEGGGGCSRAGNPAVAFH